MNATEKLKAKTRSRRVSTNKPQDIPIPTKKKRKRNTAGIDKIHAGKACGGLLNEKELAIMQWLVEAPDMIGHLKDFMPIMLALGDSDGEYQTSAKYPDSTSEGEKLAYRHSQNSTRKLLKIGAVHRIPIPNETNWDGSPVFEPGIYQMWPKRGRRLIRETLEWLKTKDKDHTPMELQLALEATGDYPSKAAVSRYVGIKARRWGSLLGDTPATPEEAVLMASAWRKLHG